MIIKNCTLCPRECNIDRSVRTGFCKADNNIMIARAALHLWEEPCICSKNGSGAIFFSNCTLKCVYCQNFKISSGGFGKVVDESHLADIILKLQDQGANNINLITATHYLPGVIKALDMVKSKLHIPVVYNSSGYEKVDTLKMLDGYIDIYLPDFKYMDNTIAAKYSKAYNYSDIAKSALNEMFRQVGALQYNSKLLSRGMIVRHLALPSHRKDSIAIMHYLADNFDKNSILVSLMSQYTPCHKSFEYKEISRKLSTFEYNSIIDEILNLGLKGFCQDKSSAAIKYTPDFNLEGI